MVPRFSEQGLARLARVLADHVEHRGVGGLTWSVSSSGEVHHGAAGTLDAVAGGRPMPDNGIFRISSLTKPVAAVAALQLVEDCVLHLDDPMDDILPELADRRVLVDPTQPIEGGATVAADRAITLRDLLTFRLGLGYNFDEGPPQPVHDAMSVLEIGAAPTAPPCDGDEYLRRLGTLPLAYQPGTRWLYHTGSDVLGVVIERAVGIDLGAFLQERVFEPLQMVDTAFDVPTSSQDRFGVCRMADEAGGHAPWDDPIGGRWSSAPEFRSGATGLVSTAEDYRRFAAMLLAGGVGPNGRVLSAGSVAAMTTDHLTVEQTAAARIHPSGAVGWGFGVDVQLLRTGPTRNAGSYGWDGGLGSTWVNDPEAGLIGVLLTTDSFTGASAMPAVCQDFWTCAYAALDPRVTH